MYLKYFAKTFSIKVWPSSKNFGVKEENVSNYISLGNVYYYKLQNRVHKSFDPIEILTHYCRPSEPSVAKLARHS